MKRFTFRLESVLKIRKFELDRTVAALAELEAERARRQIGVDKAEADLEQGRVLLSRDAKAGVDGEYLALRADGIAAGRFACLIAQRSLNELAEPLRVARERVAKARVELRSIERLREKREESYREESQALMQAELEELARSGAHASESMQGPDVVERVR
ncbi:MAG: hypothetical protein AB8G23_23700 [Myxococcota bacterium]